MKELIKRLKQQPRIGQNQEFTNLGNNALLAQLNQAVQNITGRTFTRFDAANDVVGNQTETVTAGLWSDNIASLTTFFTSSAETTAQRRYYVDVYQETPSADGAATQFSLAFGHALGSGSDSQGQSDHP